MYLNASKQVRFACRGGPRQRAIALAAVCLLANSSTALAVKFWKNSVPSGNWSVANSWSATGPSGSDFAGVPGLNEPVRIYNTNGAAHTVTLDISPPALGLLSIDLPGAGALQNTLLISTNNSLTAAGIWIGGYNGTGATTGNGALGQSAGTITTSPGSDLYIAVGTGSNGVYNLSGGQLNSSLSTVVGSGGTGTFNHSAGTHTLLPEAIGGALLVGYLTGGNGTYNLSGTGQLVSNKHEYIGVDSVGQIAQTGGTNTITGSFSLTLGLNASGQGTYNLSGGTLSANASEVVGHVGVGQFTQSGGTNTTPSLIIGNQAAAHGAYAISGGTLNVGTDAVVGQAGTGSMNITLNGVVNIANNLSINNISNVTLNGGTLRLNTVSGLNRLIFQSGTLKLANNRRLENDGIIGYFFGSNPTISAGKNLSIEGETRVGNVANTLVTVNNAVFSMHDLIVGESLRAEFLITNGGVVNSDAVFIGYDETTPAGNSVITGTGSTWNAASMNLGNGFQSAQTLEVQTGGKLNLLNNLRISDNCLVKLSGGTIRLTSISGGNEPRLIFDSGTLQLSGNRNVGTDPIVSSQFGPSPVIPFGKTLAVEGSSTLTKSLKLDGGTLKTNGLSIGAGGSLLFQSGVLELTGGTFSGITQLNIPTNGELRATGTQTIRVVGAAGSTITATGNLLIGNNTAFNGFATQGTLNVGANLVSLLDANDAVLDATSYTTLGSGGSPGTLDSFYGITLNFGGNITGYGTISTLGDITTPLINNGHIIGTSAAQRITLPGYVKGVGTFDNVTFTGTFSPGLSPTTSVVGNIALSNSSTLQIEVGGFAPGTQHDQIQASGAVALAGVLNITPLNGFQILPGDEFTVLKFTSRSGDFSSMTFTGNAFAGLRLTRLFTSNSMIVKGDGLKGDADLNGVVDFNDLLALAQHYNTSGATWFTGDFNRSGTVDFNDLLALAQNYGGSLLAVNDASAAFNADWRIAQSMVPEPSTAVAFFGCVATSLRPRRRSTSRHES